MIRPQQRQGAPHRQPTDGLSASASHYQNASEMLNRRRSAVT
jgi:hypothetical protein